MYKFLFLAIFLIALTVVSFTFLAEKGALQSSGPVLAGNPFLVLNQ